MNTRRRHAGSDFEVLLVHPERLDQHPCRVVLSRRGLALRRIPTARGGTLGPATVVPWWSLQGLSAEGTAPGPRGVEHQVVEVVTDAGTLTLVAGAPTVSVLLARLAVYSPGWRRARRPARAALARWGAVTWTVLARPLRPPSEAAHGRRRARRALRPSLACALAVVLGTGAIVVLSARTPVASGAPGTSPGADQGNDSFSMHRLLGPVHAGRGTTDLPAASAPPVAAPPSLADATPLQPHEVFGFAPYWTLNQSAGFDVTKMTTLAYFSIGVNPDGSLDQSGPEWAGYQSQALADLITRAHAAGSRVVLTVSCFDQGSLDQLTSSPSAPATLSSALIGAVGAKNLDGVNLDLEGAGSADQVGLTRLVSTVSSALKAVNPHYQVTMDTYASSAGDPHGFYNIAALAPSVDGFFVMAYQLNLAATASNQSPLTSTMFSDLTTVVQYSALIPAAKVILGVPYYGYDWPTSDGTLNAQATGGATPVAYGQIKAANHPSYWDPITDTAWTSYEVGAQWHESFYEDPASLYMEAQLAQFFHLAGMGIWALGFDGNDPAMLDALAGYAPTVKQGPLGPAATSPSVSTTTTTTTTTTPPASPAGVPQPTIPTTTVPSAPTTTTTSPSSSPTTFQYSGVWEGQAVALVTLAAGKLPPGSPIALGQLTGFATNDPSLSCLAAEPTLEVYGFAADPSRAVVMAASPTDCATADFAIVGVQGNASGAAQGNRAHAQTGQSAIRGPTAP